MGNVNSQVLLACVLAFVVQGSLPLVFFRRGRFTAGWCVTAAPFFGAALVLAAGMVGVVAPVTAAPVTGALASAAVVLAMCAVALTAFTAGSHRVPLALWHQQDDAPVHIVTWGAYARIRHPFYAAFLLMLLAAVAALPHPLTIALLVAGAVQLNRTAAAEERRLLRSEFGAEYAGYMRRTGRFFPGRRAARSADAVGAYVIGELAARADLELAEDVADVGAHRTR